MWIMQVWPPICGRSSSATRAPSPGRCWISPAARARCLSNWRPDAEVIGVDGSEDMLALAGEKAARAGRSLLFLRQDMRCLDLYGTVEGAVCVLDSLNHLLRTADIRAVLRRLRLFLEPGGLFVFDVNTPYKHRVVLGDNAFVLEDEDVVCVWRNRYIPRTCEVAMTLDFFVPAGEGRYDRLTDEVRERAYAGTTLRRLLEEEGFETLAVYGGPFLSDAGPGGGTAGFRGPQYPDTGRSAARDGHQISPCAYIGNMPGKTGGSEDRGSQKGIGTEWENWYAA